jgi:hypothetical protein
MIYVIQKQDAADRYLQMICYSGSGPASRSVTFIAIFRIICIGLKFNFKYERTYEQNYSIWRTC